MRKKFFPFILIAFLFGALFTSCENDTADPDADPRDNFLDTMQCTEYSDPASGGFGEQTYNVFIEKDNLYDDRIKVSNFLNEGASNSVYAVLTGLSLDLPEQTIGNYTVSGSATVAASYTSVSWTFQADDGNGAVSYTADFGPVPVVSKELTADVPPQE